jgi:tetratricopeptide (TPR) repeat protein
MSVNETLLKAKRYAKKGDVDLAAQIYQSVLEKFPQNKRARDGLIALQQSAISSDEVPSEAELNGLITLYNQEKIVEALAQGEALAGRYPNVAFIQNFLGIVNTRLGQAEQAVNYHTMAARFDPNFVEAHFNLGNALVEVGRSDEAVASYYKTVELNPGLAEAFNNLGNALNASGKAEDAIIVFGKALHINSAFAEAHNGLGNALNSLERYDEAIASFQKAVEINPNFIAAHNNLGIALFDSGNLTEAVASYEQALQVNPDYAVAHNNMGIALNEAGEVEAAIQHFESALALNPNYAEAHSNLCDLYEKLNRSNDLEICVGKALEAFPDHPEILFRSAQLLHRQKNYAEARAALEKVSPHMLPEKLQLAYHLLLGKAYDNLGKFHDAFVQFEAQNAMVRNSPSMQKYRPESYLSGTQELSEVWRADAKLNWKSSPVMTEDLQLVFLIGFPRSGTTLMDTILRGHSDVSVVEEQPMANLMVDKFSRLASITELNQLADVEISALREVYLQELSLHRDNSDPTQIVVDKFPLNIRNVGLIHRCFPTAKFILALRHPCDCVLSCFMQNFTLNYAMANFLTLKNSAQLYAAIMELWQVYQETLNLDVSVLKYEDLIQDIKGTCAPLIDFMGLEWDDNLLDYQQTAMARGKIDTPSYNQVVQPLYKEARGRWQNYRAQMEPVLPLLAPWINQFGYKS